MSADLLRRAAEKLLIIGSQAAADWESDNLGGWFVGLSDTVALLAKTMHPTVALAVADWLQAVRSCMDEPCRSMCCANERAAALRIARLILGEPA